MKWNGSRKAAFLNFYSAQSQKRDTTISVKVLLFWSGNERHIVGLLRLPHISNVMLGIFLFSYSAFFMTKICVIKSSLSHHFWNNIHKTRVRSSLITEMSPAMIAKHGWNCRCNVKYTWLDIYKKKKKTYTRQLNWANCCLQGTPLIAEIR